jgi:hypothetical protein
MSLLRSMVPLALLFVAAQSSATDNRYDPTQYGGRGGFAPVNNEVYAKECGACHFAYLPGFLPARSWHAILSKPDAHFGETLALPPAVLQTIESYVVENAADKTDRLGSKQLLLRQPEDVTPLRVTDIHMMRRNHRVIREVVKINSQVQARSLTNCDSCHTNAKNGSFTLSELIVPGLSRVIGPNQQF